jgi:UDP-2,4-diacetamido-2,4,6-trideoxy-beta-L-altropyranose hydrolase
MKILFRVDSCSAIGYGHIHRCLSLAYELRSHDCHVEFACRTHEKSGVPLILKNNFKLIALDEHKASPHTNIKNEDYSSWLGCTEEEDFRELKSKVSKLYDFIIVDHYSLGRKWEELAKSITSKVVVIDDLVNREHRCDVLINQTFGFERDEYSSLVNKDVNFLMGIRYTLLRKEFSEKREKSLSRRLGTSEVSQLLINFGGTDSHEIEDIFIKEICDHPQLKKIKIHIIGKNRKIDRGNVFVHDYITDMGEFLLEIDFALGAPATSFWERSCLGIPSILIQLADNQKYVTKNVATYIPEFVFEKLNYVGVLNILLKLATDINFYKTVCLDISKLSSGLGVANILNKAFGINPYKLLPAKLSDVMTLYRWQSHKSARVYSRNSKCPTLDDHIDWFERYLKSDDNRMFFLTYRDTSLGMIRLDTSEGTVHEVSVLISSNFYGNGLGLIGLNLLSHKFPDFDIYAEIHEQNLFSQKIFLNAGYKKISKTKYILEAELCK